MGLFILFSLIIAISIIANKTTEYDYEELFMGATVLCSIILILLLFIFMCTIHESNRANIEHEILSSHIYSVKNKEIAETERLSLIADVKSMNKKIKTTRKLKDNFMTGIFYSKAYAGLELIDIGEIKQSKYNIGLERE